MTHVVPHYTLRLVREGGLRYPQAPEDVRRRCGSKGPARYWT